MKRKQIKSVGTTAVDKKKSPNSLDDLFTCIIDSDDEDVDDTTDDVPVNGDAFDDKPAPSADLYFDREPDGPSSSEDEDDLEYGETIEKLKHSDPELYKFLEENDKDLLQTDAGDPAEDEDGNLSGNNTSDDDAEHDAGGSEDSSCTMKQVKLLQEKLAGPSVKAALKSASLAFHRAVKEAASLSDSSTGLRRPEAFNALVHLCISEVPAALQRFLGSTGDDPTTSKKWVQIKSTIKRYLADVTQLLCTCGGSVSMQRALLRHLSSLAGPLASEPRLCRPLLPRLIRLWCTGAEQVRVLAFLVMYQLARRSTALLDLLLTKAYLSYVKNCAFTTAGSWPGIHLMRRCLVELYCIDPHRSYQRAFLYIRQLAIHLRNAKLDKHKFQVVYNWQYVHCLLLWSALLGQSDSVDLRLLLYPLVQIMLGAVTLVPTSRHYPLRFHVLGALTKLSADTAVFIPVLPHILQVLHQTDVSRKRQQRVSMRPLDMACLLRFSDAQLKESGFRDAVLSSAHYALVQYLQVECCRVAFPELALPALQLLRRLPASHQLRQLLVPLRDGVEHIEHLRRSLQVDLKNSAGIQKWEQQLQTDGTPFTRYCTSYLQQRKEQQPVIQPGQTKISVADIPATTGGDSGESDEDVDGDQLRPFTDADASGSDISEEHVPSLDEHEQMSDILDDLEDDGDTVEALNFSEKATTDDKAKKTIVTANKPIVKAKKVVAKTKKRPLGRIKTKTAKLVK